MFTVTPDDSSVNFSVQASISIAGKFDKWDATLKFASPDVTTGSLDFKVQAASVDTGCGFKDDKLRSGDFFNADHDPYITFQSTEVVPTGPNTFSMAHLRFARFQARDFDSDGFRRRLGAQARSRE